MVSEIRPVTGIAQQALVEQAKKRTNVPKRIQETDTVEKEKTSALEEKDESSSSQMEDLVEISEFGDTVQVSEEGQDQLEQDQNPDGSVKASMPKETQQIEDFAVFPKKKDVEEKTETVQAPEKSETEDFEISSGSYTSYTDSRLEQMYLQGEISRYDYETEMERREQDEQETEDRQEAVSNAVKEFDSNMKSAARTQDAIKTAFSDQASQTTDPKKRLDIMEKLDRLGQTEEERQKQLRQGQMEQEGQKQLQLEIS